MEPRSRGKFFLKLAPAQAGNQAIQSGTAVVSALSAGAQVGPKQKFAPGDAYLQVSSFRFGNSRRSGFWGNIEYGFVGLKFTLGGKTHYGLGPYQVSLSRGSSPTPAFMDMPTRAHQTSPSSQATPEVRQPLPRLNRTPKLLVWASSQPVRRASTPGDGPIPNNRPAPKFD